MKKMIITLVVVFSFYEILPTSSELQKSINTVHESKMLKVDSETIPEIASYLKKEMLEEIEQNRKQSEEHLNKVEKRLVKNDRSYYFMLVCPILFNLLVNQLVHDNDIKNIFLLKSAKEVENQANIVRSAINSGACYSLFELYWQFLGQKK